MRTRVSLSRGLHETIFMVLPAQNRRRLNSMSVGEMMPGRPRLGFDFRRIRSRRARAPACIWFLPRYVRVVGITIAAPVISAGTFRRKHSECVFASYRNHCRRALTDYASTASSRDVNARWGPHLACCSSPKDGENLSSRKSPRCSRQFRRCRRQRIDLSSAPCRTFTEKKRRPISTFRDGCRP